MGRSCNRMNKRRSAFKILAGKPTQKRGLLEALVIGGRQR